MSASAPIPGWEKHEVLTSHIVMGVMVSILTHGLLIGVVVFGTMRGEAKLEADIEPKMLEFEEVELLALGVEKPPEQLVRISNPEPATKAPDEIVIEQPNEPVVELEKPEPEPEAKEDDRKRKMMEALSALHNPNRPTNEDVPEGSEEGVIGGTALNSILGGYASKLVAEITKEWEIPATFTAAEARGLADKVEVYVRLSDSGNIVTFQFRRRSGNEQFDDSIERRLKRFQVQYGGNKLPLPEEPSARAAVIREGLNLKNWEYTGL